MIQIFNRKSASNSTSEFRADINGLRAWAVVAVVCYHFVVPGFAGGFVGVDVFFVISGFLMTGLVIRGLERGVFSVLSFYVARVRRIMPALLLLCVVLLSFGWYLLLPPDYKLVSAHTVYALTFLSNVKFWQEAGYFDAASHDKWLLHTWSLSVEWQFYLILPLLLLTAWRLRPGRVTQIFVIGAGIAISLSSSVFVTTTHPSSAFYLLHTRAWEMLCGGLVFLLAEHFEFSNRVRLALGWLGLLLIALAVVLFNNDTVWPSWRAMLPVGAAMLVLLAKSDSIWTESFVPQWLGARSYSLYLWHWPVVVGLTYWDFKESAVAIACALLYTVFIGHFSYSWVEVKSRRWLNGKSNLIASFTLFVFFGITCIPATMIWYLSGVPNRFTAGTELAADEAKNFNPRRNECHPNTGVSSPSCVFGGDVWKVIVVGDSHAAALVGGLASSSTTNNAGVVQWSYSSCPFVLGLKITPAAVQKMGGIDYRCDDFILWTVDQLDKLPQKIPIVIVNRYAGAAFGGNEEGLVVARPGVFFSKEYQTTTPEFLEEFAKRITQSACELAKSRTVYMVRPIPEMGFNVPKTLSRRMMLGMSADLSIAMDDYKSRNQWAWRALDAARDQCGVKILDPTAYLCSNERCYGSKDGRPLYYDDDHLSEFGNKLLVPMFAEVFNAL